jgi:peptidoglycan hydrolase-like protein with peptidoglycan-binding domain
MKFLRRSTPACIALLSIFCLALPQLTLASAPFSQNLQLRDTSGDVARLQQFLNAEHFLIARSGPGSPGSETTTFGLLTYQALTQFQSAHGLPATGFFGPLTRAFIATLAATSTGTSTAPSVATSTVVASSSPTTTPTSSAPSSTTSRYIPGVTPLPGYKPNQLIFIGGGAPTPATPPASPPAPAPYVAKAVHFDGTNANLMRSTPLIGVPDSPTGVYSFWIKSSFPVTYAPAGYQAVFMFIDTTNGNIFFQDAAPSDTRLGLDFDLWNADNSLHIEAEGESPTVGGWDNYVLSWDLSVGGSHVVQIAQNGSLVSSTIVHDDGGTLNANWSAATLQFPDIQDLPFSGGVGNPVDKADVYLAPGQFLDLSIPSNIEKFIKNGKPVDLGPNCSGPIGTAPAVCFSGDATTFGTNQGTGGAFTLTGTLTDADTSPSN